MHDFRQCLYAKSVKNSFVTFKESVAITLSTNFDLAIECLGVRVPTIVVKMMKRKVATSGFSYVGCVIPGLLAMLHRMVFAVLSRSSENKICRPCSCRRLVRRFCLVDPKSFPARIGPACLSSSLDTSKKVSSCPFRWCPVAL